MNKKFTKAEAEALGLRDGVKIEYRKKVDFSRKIKIKTGTVYRLWQHQFVVIWDKGGWKEAFRYQDLQNGKIEIKR